MSTETWIHPFGLPVFSSLPGAIREQQFAAERRV
jgi:hypothetical protein